MRYEQLAELYCDALRDVGATVMRIETPGIYQTREARDAIGVRCSAVHLAVRPLGAVRPFHGLKTFAVFDGPLSELDKPVVGTLRSPAQILGSVSRTFCTTDKLTSALLARGVGNAVTLRPPLNVYGVRSASGDVPGSLQARCLGTGRVARLGSIHAETRAAGGSVIYWDGAEASGSGEALETVIDAALEVGAGELKCVLVIASGHPFSRRWSRFTGRNFRAIYRVESQLGGEQRCVLAGACDIFVRLTPSDGLDLELVSAIKGGARAVVPEDHSAVELRGLPVLDTYDPARGQLRWRSRSRSRCPDLVRTLDQAISAAPIDKAGRSASVRALQMTYGSKHFAATLRAMMSAA